MENLTNLAEERDDIIKDYTIMVLHARKNRAKFNLYQSSIKELQSLYTILKTQHGQNFLDYFQSDTILKNIKTPHKQYNNINGHFY